MYLYTVLCNYVYVTSIVLILKYVKFICLWCSCPGMESDQFLSASDFEHLAAVLVRRTDRGSKITVKRRFCANFGVFPQVLLFLLGNVTN